MDVASFIIGILVSVVLLPILFIVTVSIRRSILDGAYIGNLSSKYILITGCDTGFGFELAKRLDSLGCHVIGTCLTKEGQDGLKAVTSSRANILSMDVTKQESVKAAEELVRDLLPSDDALWGIVNNAGIVHPAPVFDFETLGNMEKVSDVNLWGMVSVTKAFLPYLKRSKGRIVNMGSVSGRVSLPGLAGYSISKFGVAAFSDCIRLELSLFGISVHLIEPSGFRTNICGKTKIKNELRLFWDKASEELRQEYGEEWLNHSFSAFENMRHISYSRKIDQVLDCMEHALLSTKAKKRYFPGFGSSWILWWMALLPADINDSIALRYIPVPKLAKHK